MNTSKTKANKTKNKKELFNNCKRKCNIHADTCRRMHTHAGWSELRNPATAHCANLKIKVFRVSFFLSFPRCAILRWEGRAGDRVFTRGMFLVICSVSLLRGAALFDASGPG